MLLYLAFVFPKLASDASFSRDDLPKLLRNPVVVSVYILSVLFATAYFTAYSYIEPFLKIVAAFSDQGITSTLMLLGVSGLVGSFVFSRFYNHFRYGIIRAGLLGLVIPFLLWKAAAGRGQGRWSLLAWSSAVLRRCSTSPSSRTHPPHPDGSGTGGYVHLFGHLQCRHRRWYLDWRAGHGSWPVAYIGYAGAAIGLVAAVYCFTAYFHFLGRQEKVIKKNRKKDLHFSISSSIILIVPIRNKLEVIFLNSSVGRAIGC